MQWRVCLLLKNDRIFSEFPSTASPKNPNQPRKLFDAESLMGLAESIRRYGVITPLTVRRLDAGFELVAGERRLRAARIAGLDTVPCYIVEANEESSSLMALLENLQRQDLDFFEEAAFLRQLCDRFNMTQQQAAERIGRTQSAVANKLRLLRLSPSTVEIIRDGKLTERHARALLRLPDESRQISAAQQMVRHGMNVEKAEKYIESLLEDKPQQRRQALIRDVTNLSKHNRTGRGSYAQKRGSSSSRASAGGIRPDSHGAGTRRCCFTWNISRDYLTQGEVKSAG